MYSPLQMYNIVDHLSSSCKLFKFIITQFSFHSFSFLTHLLPRVLFATRTAHINHIRDVAGIDHVGIGAGYDGVNL